MNLKYFLLLVGLLYISPSLNAQPYEIGAGLRLSEWYGVSGKYFLSSEKAIALIVSPVSRGAHISALLEIEKPIGSSKGLFGYAGIGPHVALWTDGRYNPWWDDDWDGRDARDYYNNSGNRLNGRAAVGMDMIIGIEYVLTEFPLSFALDWKPGVILWGNPGLILNDVALTLSFVQ